ncbi:MAG: asparagine synthase C-terminal domain-containing protein [Oscillospiraceae bacterium]|nr:asparagine synthase C-terminal domain-containing protein [Oscillospiraceae bacterium]
MAEKQISGTLFQPPDPHLMHPDELFGGYRWYHDEELLSEDESVASFPWLQCVNERASLLRKGVLGGIEPSEYIKKARRDITAMTPYLDSDDALTRKRREMFYLNYYGFMQTLSERNFFMSGAHGLTVSAPFNRFEIAEYAFNIPWHMKAYNNREKGLLRYAFNEMLPESVAWRKKSPFPKTHNPEYLKLVTCELNDIINKTDCRIIEIFDKNKLKKLVESGGKVFKNNWFGQLMSVPQIFAYMIQLEHWLRELDIAVQ